MEVTINEEEQEPKFKPITMTITIETLEEAIALRGLYVCQEYVAPAVQQRHLNIQTSNVPLSVLRKIYNDTFRPLRDAMKDRGLTK